MNILIPIRIALSALVVAALIGLSATAQATPINLTSSFHFSGITVISGGDPVPVDPVTGSFSISFDDAADVTGKAVDSIDFTAGGFPESNVFFDYDVLDTSSGTPNFHIDIYFGGFSVIAGQNDFLIQMSGFPDELDAAIAGAEILPDVIRTGFILYSKPTTIIPALNLFASNNGQNEFDTSISVPGPAALPIFAAGLAALGFTVSRRRKTRPNQKVFQPCSRRLSFRPR